MFPDKIYLFNSSISITWYGIFIAIGILAVFIVLFSYGKLIGNSERFTDFVFYDGIISIVVGFFSAAVFQAFYNYLEDPSKGFNLNGGITFIGGLIGGALCFLLIFYFFRKKIDGNITNILSLAPCCIVIAHAFGRLGCLFAGCCHGTYLGQESTAGGIYMLGTYQGHKTWGYFIPTQLYEAIFLFLLFGLFTYLLLAKKFKHNLSLYLILYGIFRFIIEFFRGDERGDLVQGISPSQFWSIVMIIASVAVYFIVEKLLKKYGEKGSLANKSADNSVIDVKGEK